jgi:hypothetical protein
MSQLPAKRAYHLPTGRVRAMNRRKRAFLESYAQCGSVAKACERAGIRDRGQAYAWKKTDSEFADAWAALAECLGDVVEGALFHRAVEGVEKAVFFQGEVVGVEKVYSDAGAMMLLRGLKPERYRENGNVNVNVGNFGIAVFGNLAMPGPAEWEKQQAQVMAWQNSIGGQVIEGTAERNKDPITRGS